jgi:hypothetical protein
MGVMDNIGAQPSENKGDFLELVLGGRGGRLLDDDFICDERWLLPLFVLLFLLIILSVVTSPK